MFAVSIICYNELANKKEGGLDKSRKRILIIIAIGAIVLVVALVVYFVLAGGSGKSSEETASIQIEDKAASGVLPTATATTASGSPTAASSATAEDLAAAKAGSLDYTKDKNRIELKSIASTVNIDPQNPCQSFGIENNWSNPFGKTVCGMATFVGSQILEPLDAMTCRMSAAALAQNYSSNITAVYKNGECLILDR